MLDPRTLLPGRFAPYVDAPRRVMVPETRCDTCGTFVAIVMRGDWPTAVMCPRCDLFTAWDYIGRSIVLSRQGDPS